MIYIFSSVNGIHVTAFNSSLSEGGTFSIHYYFLLIVLSINVPHNFEDYEKQLQ